MELSFFLNYKYDIEQLIDEKDGVKPGDTIVFDSVSRMSRNANEGIEIYLELFNRGVSLVFLKESYINSDVYRSSIEQKVVEMTGDNTLDPILEGINKALKNLARRQIELAFEQAQKEVDDLHQRTVEGIRQARRRGQQIGQRQGATLNVKKKVPVKQEILKKSRDFRGTYTDKDLIKILGIARNTYYKYKRELAEEMNQVDEGGTES